MSKFNFKQKIRNWLFESEPDIPPPVQSIGNDFDKIGALRIFIHKASGGLVIETQVYDQLKDKHHQKLHIVTSDQDLGNHLSKIITLESLRA